MHGDHTTVLHLPSALFRGIKLESIHYQNCSHSFIIAAVLLALQRCVVRAWPRSRRAFGLAELRPIRGAQSLQQGAKKPIVEPKQVLRNWPRFRNEQYDEQVEKINAIHAYQDLIMYPLGTLRQWSHGVLIDKPKQEPKMISLPAPRWSLR